MNERNESIVSASREKKTRQNMAEEINDKQLKAQREAAKAKRSSVINTILGVIVAAAVVVLLMWNAGVFKPDVDVMKIGDETYTAEDLQYYYQEARMYYVQMSAYGIDFGYDVNVPADEQIYDEESGQTWQEFFVEEATHNMSEIKVLVAAAEAEGFELSDEGKSSIETQLDELGPASARNGFNTVNSYLKAVYGDGMTEGKLEDIITEGMLASEFAAAHTEALEYTDDDVETYYTEHADELDIFEYAYAQVDGTPAEAEDEAEDETEPTDADKEQAMKAAEDKAEQLQKALQSGTAFEEAVAALGEDEAVTFNGAQANPGSYVESNLAEWLKGERQAGDVTVIKGEDCYYVVQFTARHRDTEQPADIRHILVAAEQDEGATAPTDAQYEAAKAEAEALLKQWEEGEKTEESFAELAKAESADPGSAENGGLYENVGTASNFIPEFTQWALDPARQAGDTGIVKNTGSSTKGYHIMYFVDKGEELWKSSVRATLANEATEEWIHELVEAAGVEVLDGAKTVGLN